MRTRLPCCGLLAGALLFAAGCTFPSSTAVVPSSQANQLQIADIGTVIKVTDMTIEGRRTIIGQAGGALIGGAAASPTGYGPVSKGQAIGVAAASIAGAVVGEAVEEYATRKQAQEITVLLK